MSIPYKIVLRGYKPLIIRNKSIILYKAKKLFRYENGLIHFLFKLKNVEIKDHIRILNRLFRNEPKYAVEVSKDLILLVWNKQIYLVNLNYNSMYEIARSREGFSDPLNICVSCKSSKYLAVWGDYGANCNREEVYIYGLDYNYNVEVIYTFPKGTIRHIHNIIPKAVGGYYIFTGDTEEKAGIYEASDRFDIVKPLAIGKQKYRAVVGFEIEEGLLYATDAVNEKNFIYLLQQDEIKEISGINGSCIYGTKYKNRYFFSTTVEPDERKQGVFSWFSYKKGEGILSNNVDLISIGGALNAKSIVSYKKDILPMKLFQYGSIQFPNGDGSLFAIYPIAVKKYDGDTLIFPYE